MTWENLTADADALRQALGFDKWAVLGHSFGGNVALEYALRYGQNLSHLILMNTGGDQRWVRKNAPELLAKRGFSSSAVEAARRFYSGQVTPETYQATVMKFWTAYFYHINPLTTTLGMLKGPQTVYRPEALIQGYGQLLDGWTVMDRLSEIRTPTLVLAGRYCFLFPPEHQAILADRLPHAKLELIERAGHNPQMERPVETMRAIREFLADAAPGVEVTSPSQPAIAGEERT